MRNCRASQPRARTEARGSISKRFGASGARFRTACAEAASTQNNAPDNTATQRMMHTVDLLYISIRRVALLRPVDRNATQHEGARGDFVEIHRAQQRCELSRGQKASQRIGNVSVDTRAPVKNQTPERSLRVKITQIQEAQPVGIRQKKIQGDEHPPRLQHTLHFRYRSSKVRKITEAVSDE